jgi:hypothetical protein
MADGVPAIAVRIVKIMMLLAGLALIARYDWRARQEKLPLDPEPEMLARLLPGAEATPLAMSPIPHYPGKVTEAGRIRQAAGIATARIPPKVKGYVDEINVFFVLDEDGAIRGLDLIADRETPYYMDLIRSSGFFEKFIGRNLRQGFADIDGVTGATISSKAIKADLEAAANTTGEKLFGISVPRVETPGYFRILREPRTIALAVVLILGLLTRYRKFFPGQREAVFGLSIITLGFWLNTPYCLGHSFQLLALDFPGPSNPRLLLLAGFVIITTILSGPLSCGYLCPFGALQELLYRFVPVRHWAVSGQVLHYARELRYLVLFLCVAGYFGIGINAFSEAEPFPHLFSLTKSPLAWLFILLTLSFSLFLKRFWCRFFCPTGACLVLLSSHRKYLKSIARGVADSEIDPAGN